MTVVKCDDPGGNVTAELVSLAEQVVGELARWWPTLGIAASGMAMDVVTQLRAKATDAASDAAAGWVHEVLTRLFGRRSSGATTDPGRPARQEAEMDHQVLETLQDLAISPANRSVRRLLVRQVLDAVASDPGLVDVLQVLLAESPSRTMTAGTVGYSGAVSQTTSGGVNVAVTGVAGDITARGDRR